MRRIWINVVDVVVCCVDAASPSSFSWVAAGGGFLRQEAKFGHGSERRPVDWKPELDYSSETRGSQ